MLCVGLVPTNKISQKVVEQSAALLMGPFSLDAKEHEEMNLNLKKKALMAYGYPRVGGDDQNCVSKIRDARNNCYECLDRHMHRWAHAYICMTLMMLIMCI